MVDGDGVRVNDLMMQLTWVWMLESKAALSLIATSSTLVVTADMIMTFSAVQKKPCFLGKEVRED